MPLCRLSPVSLSFLPFQILVFAEAEWWGLLDPFIFSGGSSSKLQSPKWKLSSCFHPCNPYPSLHPHPHPTQSLSRSQRGTWVGSICHEGSHQRRGLHQSLNPSNSKHPQHLLHSYYVRHLARHLNHFMSLISQQL